MSLSRNESKDSLMGESKDEMLTSESIYSSQALAGDDLEFDYDSEDESEDETVKLKRENAAVNAKRAKSGELGISMIRDEINRLARDNAQKANIIPLKAALSKLTDALEVSLKKHSMAIHHISDAAKKTAAIGKLQISDMANTMRAVNELVVTLNDPKPEEMSDEAFKASQMKAIEAFSTKTQKTSLGSKILKTIGMVCFAAIGFVAGAAIGMGIGIAAGAWTGPGAFITGAIGAASGAVIGAAAATAVATGVASGLFMFKTPFGMRHDARNVASAAKHFVDPKEEPKAKSPRASA